MTPTRGLVIASESSNADLFWAIRGAGQAFGVVTEVTLKLHPLNTLSADDGGKFWLFTFIYSQDKLEAFAATLETMSKNMSERAMGVAFMASPPPAFEVNYLLFSVLLSNLICICLTTAIASLHSNDAVLWDRDSCTFRPCSFFLNRPCRGAKAYHV